MKNGKKETSCWTIRKATGMMTVRYSCARPYGEIYSCLLLLLLAPGREIYRHHAYHGASGVAAAPLQTP